MTDAAFDRALGAWEDAQLNDYLGSQEYDEDEATEEREAAEDRANHIVWGMKMRDLYRISTGQVAKDIKKTGVYMVDMITDQILDGTYE